MESIEQRAKSYAEGCELQGKEARKAEFDYIAGAKEERILLTEWNDAMRSCPDVSEMVLIKMPNGDKYVGWKRVDGYWHIVGSCILGEDKYIKWRRIHEDVYYGDDDSRAE